MRHWRRLARTRKGAVLIETAFVVLILMSFVVGMGLVAIQGQDWQSRGRVAREAADYTRLHLETSGAMDAQALESLARLAGDRLRAPAGDFRLFVSLVRRDATTGAYVKDDTWSVGGYDQPDRLSVFNAPSPDPGVHAAGVVVPLDMGASVVVVQAVVRFTGMARGTQAGSPRQTWAVVPMDGP